MITDLTRRAYFVLSAPFPSSFAFDFWFGSADEFFAVLTLLDGSEIILVNGTDYTLTDPQQGGTLTRVSTWDSTAIAMTLYRLTAKTQETDFVAGSKSNPEVLEQALDRIVAMLQEAYDDADRAILHPITDPPGLIRTLPGVTGRALRYVSYDEDGNLIMAAGTAEAGTADAALLNGRASGHGSGSIPISDDALNTHLYAARAALADQASNAELVAGVDLVNGEDGTYGIQELSNVVGLNWLIPKGTYILSAQKYSSDHLFLDIQNNSASWILAANDFGGGIIISDGVNYRLRLSGSSANVFFRKLA